MLPSQRHLFDMPRDVCFLNAAAWSPLPLASVEAGRIGAARKARPWELSDALQEVQCERARSAAAALIHAEADDVALIPSVGYGVATAGKLLDLPRGSRILVLDRDHTSPVLEWMARTEAADHRVEAIAPGADGDWTAALEEALARPGEPPVALASISCVHWSDGGLIDLERVQTALRPHGGKLLVDATHAAGVLDLDVAALDPDFLIFPTYKWLLGPYGRAFLYVARRHQSGVPLEQTGYGRKRIRSADPVYFEDLDYVETARRFDMGERDFFVSLDVAATSMEQVLAWGVDAVRARLAMLTARIEDVLRTERVPVTWLDRSLRAPNLLGLGFPDGMPEGLPERLAHRGVYAAARLGRLRISPHVYNDEADCTRCVEVLRDLLR
ncbi:MAG: aminotransferase class V-fold PLP-dependent enzyme [Alphaproteobacteria bacterium]|nr:aminotransferase class V-fold PLP-dependent enzyme [Alphaproteobacteria bacterium]MCB9930296.1 aminotransferase class V-fold PLP-dependent enzyme [Alphaproteobacteria bacterium]